MLQQTESNPSEFTNLSLLSNTDISSVSPGFRSSLFHKYSSNLQDDPKLRQFVGLLSEMPDMLSTCTNSPHVSPLPGFSQIVGQVETNLRKSTQCKAETGFTA